MEAKNPLATLMKQRYGISRQSSITITDKDNLFSVVRKLANYIYKNGDWKEQDYCDAIKFYLEDTKMEDKVLSVKRTSIGASKVGREAEGKEVFEVQSQSANKDPKLQYMVIDPDNRSWKTQGERWTHRNHDGVFWYTGNQNYTLGYGKLFNDIYNTWLQGSLEYHRDINPDDFKEFLSSFAKHTYSSKDYQYKFETDLIDKLTHEEFMQATKPDNHYKEARVLTSEFMENHPEFKKAYGQPGTTRYFYERDQTRSHMRYRLLQFIDKYLQNTYNIIRQQKYEHDLANTSYARSWETKKNINKETQHIMEMTPLHKHFEGIELDNDVDLRQFSRFQDEAMRLMERLPDGHEKPILRLRKLGNHRAAGMYVPALNTLIVDFRRPSEVYANRQANSKEEASYSSFIHEYGHYLDYTLRKEGTPPLSLKPEFAIVQQLYAHKLQNYKALLSSKDINYLTTPTEVFARAFEIYTHDDCGLRGNLNKDRLLGPQYEAFDKGLRMEVASYFDQIPAIRNLRKTLNIDTSVEPERTFSDDRQNSIELKEQEKLANFSVDLLEKWTKDSHRLEGLISTTPKHLDMCNPNRIIAYDKWGERMPKLVSSSELLKKGIAAKKYPQVSYIQGYVKHGQKWESERLFNTKELAEAMLNKPRDYDSLQQLIHRQPKVRGKQQTVEKAVAKEITIPNSDPLEQIKNKISRYMLIQKYSETKEKAPFRFTQVEKDLVDKLSSKDKQQLYVSAVRNTWHKEPQIQQALKHGMRRTVDLSGLRQQLSINLLNKKER